jgi:hypothetical protein
LPISWPVVASPNAPFIFGSTYNTFRILLHRLLIFEDPVELQICFQAANELVDVLDHLRTRGLLEYTAAWTPYVVRGHPVLKILPLPLGEHHHSPTLVFFFYTQTVPATSLLLYVACNECEGISAANRANAWVGVHRCISVLSTLRPM